MLTTPLFQPQKNKQTTLYGPLQDDREKAEKQRDRREKRNRVAGNL